MTELVDILTVRSERLSELRAIVKGFGDATSFLGVAARYSLVIDTNVVLGDILWLVAERKDPEAKTQLMETIDAGTLDVFVPPKLLEEVEEKIPLLATQKGLDEERMHAEWLAYRNKLKVAHPDSEKVQELRGGVDPDDADFIALARTILAVGVFSKDKHIEMMGGNAISIECIAHLRDYSRATAIELNIKVNGVMFSFVSMAAIKTLLSGGRMLIEQIGAAPNWVKCLLVIALAYVAFNPHARDRVGGILKTVFSGVTDTTPHVLMFLAEASKLADSNQKKAQYHLEKVMNELESNVEDARKIGTGIGTIFCPDLPMKET